MKLSTKERIFCINVGLAFNVRLLMIRLMLMSFLGGFNDAELVKLPFLDFAKNELLFAVGPPLRQKVVHF